MRNAGENVSQCLSGSGNVELDAKIEHHLARQLVHLLTLVRATHSTGFVRPFEKFPRYAIELLFCRVS
jgi:hypothetical protein